LKIYAIMLRLRLVISVTITDPDAITAIQFDCSAGGRWVGVNVEFKIMVLLLGIEKKKKK
jgi:hypothetical protein